jgi:hypothetical protein
MCRMRKSAKLAYLLDYKRALTRARADRSPLALRYTSTEALLIRFHVC